ncbi:hypothetical protein [Listeria sp. PSOL-1]|uniref:hypothetical protein n=1 Tax=Listeria sp. PSOL-1 TaxID=1844999 RepID=UPI0013D2E8BE|nr:hypothetical protein [Listeria sp. PSOL-1]
MRVFAGIISIQASILGFISFISAIKPSGTHLLIVPESLAKNASLGLSIMMLIAGVLIICSKRDDFLLFLAMLFWVFGVILGLLFVPSFSGIYFRPVVCGICIIISFSYINFKRNKNN